MLLPHRSLALCLLPLLLAASCQSVEQQAAAVRQAQDAKSRVTVGTVQREIRLGMSGSEVVEALGSPNMVTTDEQRRETWVWDKVSTDTLQSRSSGGATILLLGVANSSSVASTNQRTLTVVVKFDQASRVRDFSYRSSSF